MKQITALLSLVILSLSGWSNAVENAPVNKQVPFTAEHLVKMKRISSAALSPDGNKVVYVLRTTDMKANRGRTDLWLTNLNDLESKQLTTDIAADHSPVWSTNRIIYFLSSRSGSSQVWRLNTAKPEPEQVTDYPVAVTTFKLSPDSKSILFSANVYPECEEFACTVKADEAENSRQSSGVVYDKMFVRHWDHWVGKKQSQLFLADLDNRGLASSKSITPISKSVNANVPSDPFGGAEEYTFAAKGNAVYFSARLQNAQEPTSTNFDIYRVDIKRPTEAENLTKDQPGWDTQPVISHNGQNLAYLSMRRAGFEADKLNVKLKNLKTGKTLNWTKSWDRSFSSAQFSKDDKYLFLTGNNLGTKALWRLSLASGEKKLLNTSGAITSVTVARNKILYTKDDLKNPSQLFVADLDGENARQVTFHNQETLQQIAFGEYEQFNFKGWNDEKVYGYIVKPANFDPEKKYPLAFLIHGGPQGSFGDHWHYRWHPQTYAGQGFVSVMIDFHGSTGYGQAFTDSISQNWGSKPFEDLQKGLAHVLDNYKFVDSDKMCALGASYGGYMINWIAGNWPDQFQCLVNHDGVFDNRMMYYATEELWFVEWENGGTYYDKPEQHEKYNPVNHVKNWKTPMLVIQGELDYRIPVTQSLATFTALQRRGIKSKLLYFPDENHWVLKPANSLQWHSEVNQWLHEFLTKK